MFILPEAYRIQNGFILNAFEIPHPKIADYYFNVVTSDGGGWEHVSISMGKYVEERGKAYVKTTAEGKKKWTNKTRRSKMVERCPTWEEMCFIKDQFWTKDVAVVQFHPAEKDYVNNHPYCLHLWRPTETELPIPDPIMVGIPSKTKADELL